MPPKKAKQTASNRSSGDAIAPKRAGPQVQTPPQNSPQKQDATAGITQAQKQALIDNLQLEGPQFAPNIFDVPRSNTLQ